MTRSCQTAARRTIYLCDDGKDPKKRKWVDSLGPDGTLNEAMAANIMVTWM